LSLRAREEIEFYIAISPWLIGFVVFTIGPILFSLAMSFTDWTGLTSRTWVGIENYWWMFTGDPEFFVVLKNTLYFTVGSVILGTLTALGAAILMNQKVPGIYLFRVLYYLPSVTIGVAMAIVFSWMFNPQMGVVNYFLKVVGIKGPLWLGSTQWAMPALIILSIWGIGSNMVILLAGLQGIPDYLYEAARIDGANKWHELVHVTLPMLSPSLFFVVVVSIIYSLQVFDIIFIMTNAGGRAGGPGNATRVFMIHLFQNAFEYQKMGYASALAWILFMIILVFTWLQFKGSRYWVYYEFDGEKA
jgi:multiple sugar transport system permease protein